MLFSVSTADCCLCPEGICLKFRIPDSFPLPKAACSCTGLSVCVICLGVIDLRDCSGVVSSVKEIRGHKNIFNVVTKRRCYHLSADTVTEKDKWVYELQRIVNDCKVRHKRNL